MAGSKRSGEAERGPRVLFACTYNATRSPMAQALFEDAFKARQGACEAHSAGVYTGAPIDPMAIEVSSFSGFVYAYTVRSM